MKPGLIPTSTRTAPFTSTCTSGFTTFHNQTSQSWNVFTNVESLSIQKPIMEHKTLPCTDLPSPRRKFCSHSHSSSDPKMSPYIIQGKNCPQKGRCNYYYNSEEYSFHLANYKSTLWSPYNEVAQSDYFCGSYNIDLLTFKTKKCSFQMQHNHKHCLYYHNVKDKRRVSGCYSADKCLASETSSCPLGDRCSKSHNTVEKLYHPDKFKTKYCNYYPNRLHLCQYYTYCSFAHSDEELKVELLHYLEKDIDFYLFYFKTSWCPFNHDHNKADCVYAHNWQDFRRKPHLFQYKNQMCPNWQSENFITEYKRGCIHEHNCGYCHGWKEQLYHPLTYKIDLCPDLKKCLKELECPYFHNKFDRRYIESAAKFYPRLRNYFRNCTLVSSNNINIQRELELSRIGNKDRLSESRMSCHYSEEVKCKPILSSTKELFLSTKYKESYDLTLELKKVEQSTPFVNIVEENPDSPREDNLLEIFKPQESDKNTSLFFSPKISQAVETNESAIIEHKPFNLELDNNSGYKSCPATPLPRDKEFTSNSIPKDFELSENTEPTTELLKGLNLNSNSINDEFLISLLDNKEQLKNEASGYENLEISNVFTHRKN